LPAPTPKVHDREHGENPRQRLNRRYAEIPQEVRVAQTGAQVMLGFLLTLAFTPRFAMLTNFQQALYVTSLVIGASAAALLIGPAAFHRIVFHRDLKHTLVTYSNRFAYFGLILLMLSLSFALLLILDVVLGSPRSIWIAGAITGWFSSWWYAVPLWNRARHRRGRQRDRTEPAIVTIPRLARQAECGSR
jgi:hypothetical protein